MGVLRDRLAILGSFSPARLGTAVQVWTTYHLSRWLGRPLQPAFPISVSIEPTTSCNLRCPECPSGLRSFTRPTGMLQPELFERIVKELAPNVSYLTFYFQGEPYLNPNFLSMVRFASNHGIYTSTSTNAHYLTTERAEETVRSGLKRLIISIDGTTQETYAAYRVGGSLEKVLEGTREMVEAKSRLGSPFPHLVFQFLVVKPNEHQVEEVKRLAHEMGVDEVVLKTAQIYDFENGSPLIPDQTKYARYRQNEDGRFELKNPMHNQCWKMWHSCVITWDGKVVPCCFDKDASHPMGDLKKNTFGEIWRAEAYQRFRRQLLTSRKEIDICKNCTEGTKVWA